MPHKWLSLPDVRERLPDLSPPTELPSEQVRFRFFDHFARFLRAAARRQALVLVLDDLHWFDTPSLLLLRFLARDLAGGRLLIIATYRDIGLDRQHPLMQMLGEVVGRPGIQDLPLRGLSEPEVAAFVTSASGQTPAPQLITAIAAQTDGNPFFLTEVVRLLVAEPRLMTSKSGQPLALPVSRGVRAAIGRRVQALSLACQHMLIMAAVLGREWNLTALEALGQRFELTPTGERLQGALEEAVAARIIAVVPHAVSRYSFTHALIWEALYEELNAARRVQLHRQIPEVLERLLDPVPAVPGPPTSGQALAELAYHAYRAVEAGGDPERAIAYATRAGGYGYASQPSLDVSWDQDTLKNPPFFGYPAVPPNWESLAQLQANKPSFQVVARQFCGMVWGDVADDSTRGSFSVTAYPPPNPDNKGIGTAPFSYWRRNLDSYTQILGVLDERVGQVVAAMPRDVARNTVILFTSDHGEYAGAHGLVSGKVASGYDEALRVPLIVMDPTGRFTGDIDEVRTQLTSSVDFLPLIVSLGHNGSTEWIRGDLAKIYGRRYRLDMIPLLRSSRARGRPYVLFATDETRPSYYNFLEAPIHVMGVRTEEAKLCLYANWRKHTTDIVVDDTMQVEFYDYSTEGGRLEIDNTPDDRRAMRLRNRLLRDLIPHELRAPLPRSLRAPQAGSERRLIAYLDLLDGLTDGQWAEGAALSIVGYGLDVP